MPLAGTLLTIYVAGAWILWAGLSLVVAALDRLGLAGDRLVSAPVAWTLAGAILAHASLNETARVIRELEPIKVPLRVGIAGTALWLLVRWLLRPARTSRRTRGTERAVACVAIPAALAAIGLLMLRAPGSTPPVGAPPPGPRFEPEPAGSFQLGSDGRPRVLLLGLDGASWDRIDRGIEAGSLPTFTKLVAGGLRAPLRSVVPSYSPRIWTSIVTGVGPEVHGIEDFYLLQLPRLGVERLSLRRAADWAEEVLDSLGELRRVPVTSTLRRQKAIWNLADEAGLRSGVLGLWATWPPERLTHGFVASDHASLARRTEWLHRRKVSGLEDEIATHPPELSDRLEGLQRSPDSVTRLELGQFMRVDDTVWREFESAERFSKGVKLSAFRSTHLNDAFFLGAAHQLWEEEQPDLLVVYAKAIDELSHFFYEAGVPEAPVLGWSAQEIRRYGRVVERTYAWTDRQIAPLVEAVDRDDNTLLIVVSDHGWARERDGGYNHNDGPPGILLLYGKGVCRLDCPPLRDPSVYDITPTILERLRLPLSEELVGRVLTEAFEDPNPVRRVARYGRPLHTATAVPSVIDAELDEKLQALGYLD
ncbi:MAG: alkaline phosphatase family protein [Myxococcota bacterium]